jgi:5-formyltetrahydrofolate cyclo-ligase
MHMGRLTEMERLMIEEQLRAEDICAKKVQLYMSVSRDPAVQAVLQQIAEKGQRHISTLNSMLQDAGFSSMTAQH